jgi:hypothetical protein
MSRYMKVCNCKLDHCNGHRTCQTLTSNEIAEIPVTLTCLLVAYHDSKCKLISNPLNIESVERYIHCMQVISLMQVILLSISVYIHRKLTMAKLKLSHMTYNWIVSLPPAFISNKIPYNHV